MQQLQQMRKFVVYVVGAVAVWPLLLCCLCLLQDATVVAAHEHHTNPEIKAAFPTDGDFFPALNEFSTHSVIRPQIQHGRHKRSIRSTLDAEDGLHVPHITLSFQHEGKRVYVDLQRNDRLLPDEHFLRYQNSKAPQGHELRNFTKTDVELCHYQGSVRGKPDSHVAVSTCHGGVNGVVFDGIDTYFIHSGSDGRLQDDHFLFRHSDLLNKNASCGYNSDHDHDHTHDHHIDTDLDWDKLAAGIVPVPNRIDGSEFNRILRYKRSYDDNKIRGPYNANKHSSYVELVIVVDNKVYKAFGESMKKVHNHCKDLANIINALYVPLNIFVALVGVVIWNESNEIEFSSDGDVTLRNFLNYRRTKLVLEHPNDNAQLLTKEQFNGGVVGKALKGPICTHEYSGGVSMQHSQIIAVVATTMAHEMGHNFGMEHDSPDCRCQDEKCIMSASSTSVVPVHWSSCSIDQLNIAFSRGMNYCLRNKPAQLFDSPQCGNGFVEPGEQCDCGLPSYCENSCCDPHTCMLHTNASCATGECCDLTTCRPKGAGTECRNAENECDLPEYCTGESEYCPHDVYKRDTELCDHDNAYCYQGNCRSHTNQCRILWGATGESSEHCYWKNTEGKRGGNCGYDRLNNTFIPCEPQNVACGMLHCRHLNERLEFGMESAAVLSHSFINHGGNIVPCRTALVDLGLQSTDPGLTPNGAKCGDDRLCVNQQCLSVAQVRATGSGKQCAENCNGNGVCNSRGNCHCAVGYAGASCMLPGPGGSVDSGPATNPNSHDAFQRFMYIFFFAVIPGMAAFCFFMYYCRNRTFFMGGKLAENIIKSAGGGTNNSKQSQQQRHHAPNSSHALTPNGSMPKSTPSSTDDMNSALLKSPSGDSTDVAAAAAAATHGMFGKFKGFTLRPLNDERSTQPTDAKLVAPNVAFVHPVSKAAAAAATLNEAAALNGGVPQRLAPPPPIAAGAKNELPPTHKGTWGRKSQAPALPPPNPGTQPRPIISLPVLETSTCTHAQDLTLPLQPTVSDKSPVRAAPLKPAPAPPVPLHVDPKLNVKRDGTIRRIASFLKKEDKQQQPLKEKTYMDREKLKNIEISAPMPQVAAETSSSNSDSEQQETKNLVKRAQSMRSPSKKTHIQSFGSMRSPPGSDARPKSIVNSAARPKSPPPRPPPLSKANSTTSSGYQLPITTKSSAENSYDDCEFVERHARDSHATLNDNIYAVIDEIPPAAQTLKRSDLVSVCSVGSAAGGVGDLGLLSEIVNEIEKRNGDSIYTASTLNKAPATKAAAATTNTPKEELKETKTTKVTSPVNNETAATKTSGGYLRATPLNAPIARVAPTRSDLSPTTAFSSFKPTTVSGSSAKSAAVAGTATHQSRYGGATAINKTKSFSKSPTPLSKKPTTAAAAPTSTTTTKSTLPATTATNGAAAAVATPPKPKPLTTKPSVATNARSNVNVAGSRLGRAPSTTTASSTASKFGGSSGSAAAPRAAPVVKSTNIASLQQRFEGSSGGGAGVARK